MCECEVLLLRRKCASANSRPVAKPFYPFARRPYTGPIPSTLCGFFVRSLGARCCNAIFWGPSRSPIFIESSNNILWSAFIGAYESNRTAGQKSSKGSTMKNPIIWFVAIEVVGVYVQIRTSVRRDDRQQQWSLYINRINSWCNLEKASKNVSQPHHVCGFD